jgi:mono/diheme cytochrome c family protein
MNRHLPIFATPAEPDEPSLFRLAVISPSASACVGLLFAGAALFGTASFGAAKPGDAVKGKDTFSSNCDVCHNTDSAETKVGPGLKGVFKKANLNNKKKVTDANVMELINKGSPLGMPSFEDQLSDRERADVLAYLKTL